MKTARERLSEFGEKKETQILEIIDKINSGAKFNGRFYTERGDKIVVYVNGEKKLIGEAKFHGEELKEIFALLLVENTEEGKRLAEWLVDGKKVYNTLNWGQMWDRHGTDFE